MSRHLRNLLPLVNCLVFVAMAESAERSQPATTPALKVPPGFEVELVAGPPLVEHPTMAGFDDQGRLYVCDGPGQNLPAKQLLTELPNLIRRLEDTDGDGRFDRSVTYADKMTFPMGALWHRGSVYTASPPHIWRLTDTDGDGVADERKILVSEFGFNGNAADIHGCFLGPDGRLYWCDGRHGHNFVDEQGNQISKGLAARVFRCRLDGRDVETFAGGGMDNPVELCFTEQGEPLGTVAIFDIVDGRHDALVHWVYGGVYPRYEQRCLEEFRRTGPLLPPVSRFVGVAPAGVMRYRGRALERAAGEQIFHAQFNTHTVVRTMVERSGGTFRSQDEPFLTSDNSDFHPTDVLEDADGSLLVIDTGGWFRIGCPTSQIAKPEVLGGIYRVRRTGAPQLVDPRGKQLAWDSTPAEALIDRLADDRPAVRDRAQNALVVLGESAVDPLARLVEGKSDDAARGRALWALSQIGSPAALGTVRSRLADSSNAVRQIAARSAVTSRDALAFDALASIVATDEPAVRRDAATALGHLGRAQAVIPLLAGMRSSAGDRFVEHAIIYALIEVNARSETAAALSDEHPDVRRAALIALDQMPDGQLTREQVAPLLATSDTALLQTALEVIERHAGWASEIAPLLSSWLAERAPSADRQTAMRGALLAFCREEPIQRVATDALASASTSAVIQWLLLDVIARCDLTDIPSAWDEQIRRHLRSADAALVRQAVATAAARNRAGMFDAELTAIAANEQSPAELRLAALAACRGADLALGDADVRFLQGCLRSDAAPLDRLAAAGVLGRAKLATQQRSELVTYLAAAGPLELPALLGAFDSPGDEPLGRRLVAALDRSPGVENLSRKRIEQVLANYPSPVLEAAQTLLRRLDAGAEQQREHLTRLAAKLETGDAKRGKNIFLGAKATCAACHRAAGQGGTIGPDLSKVGQMRSRIDLLESLVYPSASFVRGYESYQVLTDSGHAFAGILSRETGDAVFLRTAQREEIRIPRREIEELVPSKLSIMPQGFDRLLSIDELRDVLAYLQSLK
ncbi:MAG TPA: PVC-type heme-binding CxxCH protein [Pirellulales bacterium]|jgi:putative membrane-bound dehydrogenase-like protein|nr:PVC-type heme-binding CxxCH protein [Pirellulales bacterium]